MSEKTVNCAACGVLVWEHDVPIKRTGNCWRCDLERLAKEVAELKTKAKKKKEQLMTDDTGACCAHQRVWYKPIDNGDGSLSARWECTICGHEFVPVSTVGTVEPVDDETEDESEKP